MKKYFSLMFVICMAVCMYAQPPGGGGSRGGMRLGGPPPGGMGQRSSDAKLILEHFPEIPDLTLEQREKVGSILTGEMKDVKKEMSKKRDIEKKIKLEEVTEKELEKLQKEISKIDKKIQDIKNKSDKKIKKVLSDDQYLVFLEKREEFKFKPQNERPRFRDREEGDDDSFPPRPPFGEESFE